MPSSLTVLEAGVQSTVQDLGRWGYMGSGVPCGGAADALSLRVGNLAVGNAANAGGLEMTLVGASLRFDRAATICLSGALASDAVIEGNTGLRKLEGWESTPVDAGEVVRVGAIRAGARVYLCIRGGVATPPILGSRSVHIGAGLGYPGRALVAGDRVPLGDPQGVRGGPNLKIDERTLDRVRRAIWPGRLRAVVGEDRGFSGVAFDQIFRGEFTVAKRTSRMGTRLSGVKVPSPPGDHASEGVLPGSVQVPAAGAPIVLGVDGPTTGGYPVIATVIAADLPALGQLAPGDAVRFDRVARDEAIAALHAQRDTIRGLADSFASRSRTRGGTE